jgi:glycosyltransferase involved in cell wall biosynthesis
MKVSVIIPTRNRFSYLLDCINSVKAQTYKDLEIIVVDDCSSQTEYKVFDWEKIGVRVVRLTKSTDSLLGHTSTGFAYNIGVYHSSGELVAFCDDRDLWYPDKLERQVSEMERVGCDMSCSDAFTGRGRGVEGSKILYHGEHYRADLDSIFKGCDCWSGKIPEMVTLPLMVVHNVMIGGTVVMKKFLYDLIGGMKPLVLGDEGYDCWKRGLEHTECVHLEKPGIYYDLGRGNY